MSCLWPGRGLSNGPSPKSYHSTNSTSSPQPLLCPVSTIHLNQQRFCYVCCRGQRSSKTINQRICLLQFLGNLCNKYSKYFSRRSATASTSGWSLHRHGTGCMLSITIKASIRLHNQLVQLTSLTTNKLGLK